MSKGKIGSLALLLDSQAGQRVAPQGRRDAAHRGARVARVLEEAAASGSGTVTECGKPVGSEP